MQYMQRMQTTYVVQVNYKDVRYGAIKLANLFQKMFFFKETKLNINHEGEKHLAAVIASIKYKSE